MNPAPPVTSILFSRSSAMVYTTKSIFLFGGVNRVYVEDECYKNF